MEGRVEIAVPGGVVSVVTFKNSTRDTIVTTVVTTREYWTGIDYQLAMDSILDRVEKSLKEELVEERLVTGGLP